MLDFLVFIKNLFVSTFDLVNTSITFDIGGMTVGFYDIVVGFIVLGFIISIFWKGART